MTNSPLAPAQPPAFIEVGEGNAKRAIAVRARPGRSPGLFWLGGFKSDMAGHQGAGARCLGSRAWPRLCPVRLFRPWRIRRQLRRRHHRTLAGGERRGIRAILPRTAGRDRLLDGRLDGTVAGARDRKAPGRPCLAGRAGADRAGAGFHRRADVEGLFARDPHRRSRPRAFGCGRRNMATEPLSDHARADRGGPQPSACSAAPSMSAARCASCRARRIRTCPGSMRLRWRIGCRPTTWC